MCVDNYYMFQPTSVILIFNILTSGVSDPQFKIRPEPDPDLFFKLGSDRNRNRIFFQIRLRPDPELSKSVSGRIRIQTFQNS